MKIEVEFSGTISTFAEYEGEVIDHDAEIERCFDRIAEELHKLECEDPMVSGSIATGEIEITALLDAEDWNDAARKADGVLRAALHAAGVYTDDWTPPRPHFELAMRRFSEDLIDA